MRYLENNEKHLLNSFIRKSQLIQLIVLNHFLKESITLKYALGSKFKICEVLSLVLNNLMSF